MSRSYPTIGEIVQHLDDLDDLDIVERAGASRTLRSALEWFRPPNLWGAGIAPDLLLRLARDEGIPLAWVPRLEVVRALVVAPNRRALSEVLADHASQVIEDCTIALRECVDERLQEQVPLAEEAIASYRAGYFRAAMALAVSLGDPLALWASKFSIRLFDSRNAHNAWRQLRAKRSRYRWAEMELGTDPPDRIGFCQQLVVAPVPRFFTPFFTAQGITPPEALSRHVVAHHATAQHFTVENSLVAIMLMASLLREQQARCEAEPSGAG